MGNSRKLIVILSAALYALHLLGIPGEPALSEEVLAGAITRKTGKVVQQKIGAGSETEVNEGADFFVGDRLVTRQGGRSQLTLRDGSFLDLGEDTVVRVNQYSYDEGQRRRTTRIRVLSGTVRAVLFQPLTADSLFYIEAGQAAVTPRQQAIVVIRATGELTEICVMRDGAQVRSVNPYLVVNRDVEKGMMTEVRTGSPPSSPRSLSREEWKRIAKDFQ